MPPNDEPNGVSTPAEEPLIGRELWRHPAPETTQMHAFKNHISLKYGITFGPETDAKASLWRWSVDNIPEFWCEVWNTCGIRASRQFNSVP